MEWYCLRVAKIMRFRTSHKEGFLAFGVPNVPNVEALRKAS